MGRRGGEYPVQAMAAYMLVSGVGLGRLELALMALVQPGLVTDGR